jgi:hypothetical protein
MTVERDDEQLHGHSPGSVADGLRVTTPHNHAVSFYDRDSEVVADVARYLAEGLAAGERVIVVATAQHRAALDDVLVQYGTDTVRARVSGRYLTFDAGELLDTFMVDGAPDAVKFDTVLGGVIDAATEDGCAVRVFGEMVALLWDQDNVAGAVELESLWNHLATRRHFSLLCAYPSTVLAGGALGAANHICALHSNVIPPRQYSAAAPGTGLTEGPVQSSDVFVPVPAAIPAARRFVMAVLSSWGEDALLADAAVVTSELATNAVEHAVSPFRVLLQRIEDVVRITVEDVGPSLPEIRPAVPDALGGRGVAIVDHLALVWGCDSLDDRKSVWAELTSRRAHPGRPGGSDR